MKAFFANMRNVIVAGFFLLLPVFVIFIVLTKAWTSLHSVGTTIAGIFGMKSILGLKAATISTSLLLLAICYICGLLVRFSFMTALSRSAEAFLSKYIPGYETYRAMAEAKLQNKTVALPYKAALVWQADCWQPAYIIEEDQGQCVVLVPSADPHPGHIFITTTDRVQMLPSVAANELQDSLKQMGKGLLRQSGLSAANKIPPTAESLSSRTASSD